MFKCGCGMMIECEVKTGQTVESIERTRVKGGELVGIQASNGRWLKEGCLWKEWKQKRGETAESIEHIKIEGVDRVGVKLNERGN